MVKRHHKESSLNPKVLYYSHSADVSGAEISLLMTISHMKQVETVLVAPKGELLDRATSLQISVIPAKSFRARMTRNPIGLLRGLLGTMSAGLELRRIVQEQMPDVVHANSIRAGLIALVGVLGIGTRLIWHVRDNLPMNSIGRMIRWIASRRVHKVFAISNAIQSNFANRKVLERKTVVVHNGINLNQDSGHSLRREFGTPDQHFVVGVVGQIAPWKRQHDALTAFRDFHFKCSYSELWVVGAPKFREENAAYFEQLKAIVKDYGIQDSVRFLGFRDDIMNVMSSIDTLLVPSENEPFGRVVIEAMLAGKPVIATNDGGIPEIVLHDKTGYLVELGDDQTMAKLLRLLYTHPAYGKQLGTRGRMRVQKNFSIQSKADQIRAQYQTVVPYPLKRRGHSEAETYRFGSQ